MINVFYSSPEFVDFVKNLSYAKDVILNYNVDQNSREFNILQDLKKLLKSKNMNEAYDTIIYASRDFKIKFDYIPVGTAIAYFRGDLPKINADKIKSFINKIIDTQNGKLNPGKTR